MDNDLYKQLPIEFFVRRLRLLPCEVGTHADVRRKAIFMSELASLGYESLEHGNYSDSVLQHHKLIIDTLTKLKAGHVAYVPLFTKFPDEIPSDEEHLARRVFGFVANKIGLFNEGRELDSGMIVPEWLFDLEDYGADPITQFQDKELFEKGKANQAARESDSSVSLSPVRFVTPRQAFDAGIQFLHNVLYAGSSVKETLKGDVEMLLAYYADTIRAGFIDGEKVTFKENKAYLLKFFWERGDYDLVKDLVSAPTDLLRLFAALTDSDISLAEKIKFPKLSRLQRRWVMHILDGHKNLAEDMVRYRGLWLAIGKNIHAGEHRKLSPNAADAFDALRNARITTWNSAIEQRMNDNAPMRDILEQLSERPGEFARRLHHVLRLSTHQRTQARVVNAFEQVADRVSPKTLFLLDRYFASFDAKQHRAVINKKGRIKVMENTLPDLDDEIRGRLVSIIQKALVNKLAIDKDSWEDTKVWIDPELKSFVAPFAQRKASEAFLAAGRGTRMKLDTSKVLRLFIYWKEQNRRTDLDLSLVEFDESMAYLGHVSYTRLSGDGIVHSGDITSAPQGAAEFIDVDIARLKAKGVRYIAPQVYRYAGDSFADMDECYVGWMGRKKTNKAYKSFDIKTVENAFTLNGNSAYAIPVVVDLMTNEVIYTDLYVGSRPSHNRVENSLDSLSAIAREVARFVETKPNVYDLANFNVIARGAKSVENREEADYTVGITGCDLNATEVESILAELV